jgi:hypothetical protein
MLKQLAFLGVTLLLSTSTHAQSQTASLEPTMWDHNGSLMYLVTNGSSREFYYQKPRPGMLEAGAQSGTLLFRGQVDNRLFSGTAYIFDAHCGKVPFQVKGPILDNDERVVLTGQAPRVGRSCRTYSYFTSKLEFRLLKPSEVPQSQQPAVLKETVRVEQSKRQETSKEVDEPGRPSTPAAQPSVLDQSPSAPQDLENRFRAAMLIVSTVSLFGFAIWVLAKH